MADEGHHSFFEEAFFANRSRKEPFELLYDNDDIDTDLVYHFGHEDEWGVDEDDQASVQRNSRSESVVDPILPQEHGLGATANSPFPHPEDVSVIAHNAVTQHLVYTPSTPNCPNPSPESSADSQDNKIITQDDAASLIDDTSMELDNPLSAYVPSRNIHSDYKADTAVDSPEPVLANTIIGNTNTAVGRLHEDDPGGTADSALNPHEAKTSQPLEESNPFNKMAYSSAPLNPSTVAPPTVEVVCQKLASLDVKDNSDRPVTTESSTTSIPACFRLPIRRSGRCGVIRTINGFRLRCPCPV